MEEEEEEEEDGMAHEQLSNVRVSTDNVLLSTPLGGLDNPAFIQEDNAGGCRSRTSSQWRRLSKCVCVLREQPYNCCRSLSSSMENITFSSTQSPKRTFRDNASVHCSRSRGIIIMQHKPTMTVRHLLDKDFSALNDALLLLSFFRMGRVL